MNTTTLITEGLASGKLKKGTCDSKNCGTQDILFNIGKDYICGPCLDKIGKALDLYEKKASDEDANKL